MPCLLVIDNDRDVLEATEKIFAGTNVNVVTAIDASQGIARVRERAPDVAVIEIDLPETSGLDLYREIKAIDARMPVVFVTNTASSDIAIEAMSLGAYDIISKPLDYEQIGAILWRAMEIRNLMAVPVKMATDEATLKNGDAMVGQSAVMQAVYKSIGRVAPQDVIVLIRGESGTGKELVARAIYQHSPRSDGPFLAVNCAALPEALLESELFGHEKGSFTGADRRHIGKFEQCSGGTLFLDEVGDMSPAIQSKFLRVLQEQKFERVGGTKTLETDVRIIAATNRPLEKMVADGEFREDLFYRLNGFMIHLPSLRERADDVPLLLEYYLLRLSKELGKEVTGFSADALELLAKYSWPGNVRELQSVLRQAIVHATGPLIVPEWLPQTLRSEGSAPPVAAVSAKPAALASPSPQPEAAHADLDRFIDTRLAADTGNLYAEALELMERTLLTRVLSETDGNQSKAAAILGITRGCLRGKIRSLGIAIQRSVGVKGADIEEAAAV